MDTIEFPEQLALRYMPDHVVGKGGTGVVVAAMDTRLRRLVAVKLLKPGAHDPITLRRFRREALALAGLNHPHILRIFDAGADEGQPYLVTELLNGTSLENKLRKGPLAQPEALELLEALLDALTVVHAAGLLHRDIKPTNVMLRPVGGPVLIDFGLARSALTDTLITAEGHLVGTPYYLAPEVVRGSGPSFSSDLFGMAAVACEALTGRRVHAVRVGDREELDLFGILRGDYLTRARSEMRRHGSGSPLPSACSG
jgi:serine/threonine protein kinase